MATETVAALISNSRSSDDEILGLTTHVPRRNGRAQSNSSARESGRDEQLDLDFGSAGQTDTGSDGVFSLDERGGGAERVGRNRVAPRARGRRRVYGLVQMTPRGQGRTSRLKNSETSQEDVLRSYCAACAA
jgi:hypothetical protein